MGFGSTAKKVQQMVDTAEKLLQKFDELRSSIEEMRDTVADTNDRVARLEDEVAAQRELLERVAEAEGVSVEDADVAGSDGSRGDGND